MAVESLEYLTIKSVKKCMHPVDNTKLASYKITFKDDPLRMLRAIRFASQLSFDIESKTFKGIAEAIAKQWQ